MPGPAPTPPPPRRPIIMDLREDKEAGPPWKPLAMNAALGVGRNLRRHPGAHRWKGTPPPP